MTFGSQSLTGLVMVAEYLLFTEEDRGGVATAVYIHLYAISADLWTQYAAELQMTFGMRS